MTDQMNSEEAQERWEKEDFPDAVSEHSDPSWRHGTRETHVFKFDDEFWQAYFRLSTDGEVHELREGIASWRRVMPKEITKVVYVKWEDTTK